MNESRSGYILDRHIEIGIVGSSGAEMEDGRGELYLMSGYVQRITPGRVNWKED